MRSFLAAFKGFLNIGFLMVLSMTFIEIDAADCMEQTYYSIHVASFKDLQRANRHVNATKKKGKMVFWKETMVPEKGRFYRIYLGKYENRAEAVEFWKELKKIGAVSYYGIHEFTETVEPKKVSETDGIKRVKIPQVTTGTEKSKKNNGASYDGTLKLTHLGGPKKVLETNGIKRVDIPHVATGTEKTKKDNSASYDGANKLTHTGGPKKLLQTVSIKQDENPPMTTRLEGLDAVQPFNLHPTHNGVRFVDNRDGTITDTKTNLMWVKNGWRLDFLSAVTWSKAVEKSETFRLGKYTNWRLPTREEWESLIDTEKQYPALIEPNPFENIIVHMPYWSKTEFTFGPKYRSSTLSPIHAYIVMLYFGNFNFQNKKDRAFVLPVRSMDQPYSIIEQRTSASQF